jgi:transposase
MGRSIDPELKRKVLEAVGGGASVHDVAKRFKVPSPTIYAWVAKRRKDGQDKGTKARPGPAGDTDPDKRLLLLELEVKTLREFIEVHGLTPPKF